MRILLFLLFSSCAFINKDKEKADKDIPDIILYDSTNTFVKNQEIKISLHAKITDIYNEKKRQDLKEVTFNTFKDRSASYKDDNSFKQESQGQSDRATIYTEDENIEFKDNVNIDFEDEKKLNSNLKNQYLLWNNKERFANGLVDDLTVIVQKENNDLKNLIKGNNFFFDAKKQVISFKNNIYAKIEEE